MNVLFIDDSIVDLRHYSRSGIIPYKNSCEAYSIVRWGIFHGTERSGNGTQVPEVNVCIHTLAKLLATHHYKYNSTSTKQEIDQTPGPVVLAARSSLACY